MECVPRVGDQFNYRYHSIQTLFEVVCCIEGEWLCRAIAGKFRGLEIIFEQEQLLMLIGVYRHAGEAAMQ